MLFRSDWLGRALYNPITFEAKLIPDEQATISQTLIDLVNAGCHLILTTGGTGPGGAFFEPSEANPMLGFRGAARYSHPAYAEGFALECRAMKRVREEMEKLAVLETGSPEYGVTRNYLDTVRAKLLAQSGLEDAASRLGDFSSLGSDSSSSGSGSRS